MDILLSFIAAAFGGGLLVFVQFLITRHDNKEGYIASLTEKIDGLFLKVEQDSVTNLRRYIFEFSIECRRGIIHTKEEWDQCLQDITEYRRYCSRHPEFVNGRCDIAIEQLEEIYRARLDKKDFAQL